MDKCLIADVRDTRTMESCARAPTTKKVCVCVNSQAYHEQLQSAAAQEDRKGIALAKQRDMAQRTIGMNTGIQPPLWRCVHKAAHAVAHLVLDELPPFPGAPIESVSVIPTAHTLGLVKTPAPRVPVARHSRAHGS